MRNYHKIDISYVNDCRAAVNVTVNIINQTVRFVKNNLFVFLTKKTIDFSTILTKFFSIKTLDFFGTDVNPLFYAVYAKRCNLNVRQNVVLTDAGRSVNILRIVK